MIRIKAVTAFPGGPVVKNQAVQVQSLVWEDPTAMRQLSLCSALRE